jgi:transcriptional regulator with XRE-family HTH domain
MITEIGKQLRLLRINTGDSLRTMSTKLGISAAYLSSIENGKRNVPDEFDKLIFAAYSLSEREMKIIKDSIYNSKEKHTVDLTTIDDKKRKVLLALTEENLHEETIDKLCALISEDNNKTSKF